VTFMSEAKKFIKAVTMGMILRSSALMPFSD
jgi:hypothetical protein